MDTSKGMVMNDKYLAHDQDYEDQVRKDEWVEEKTRELMRENDDFRTDLFENFWNDVYECSGEEVETIEFYLANKDFEKLGRLVWSISMSKREVMAEKYADQLYGE